MDKKVIAGILIFTVLIIVGAILFSSNSSSKTNLQKTAGASIQTFETSFDFKDIKYSGGNVDHQFKIKNSGTSDLTIANMSTSCMCTQVFFQNASIVSPRFGMTGHASEGAWKGVVKPGEEALVVAVFDPTAHGPQGVGPVSRLVSFETNDPDYPYVEFAFNGVVVK